MASRRKLDIDRYVNLRSTILRYTKCHPFRKTKLTSKLLSSYFCRLTIICNYQLTISLKINKRFLIKCNINLYGINNMYVECKIAEQVED